MKITKWFTGNFQYLNSEYIFKKLDLATIKGIYFKNNNLLFCIVPYSSALYLTFLISLFVCHLLICVMPNANLFKYAILCRFDPGSIYPYVLSYAASTGNMALLFCIQNVISYKWKLLMAFESDFVHERVLVVIDISLSRS